MSSRVDLHVHSKFSDRPSEWILRIGSPEPGRVQNFKPVGQFRLPENETVTLAFPPLLDILEYCDREQLDEPIISTPA